MKPLRILVVEDDPSIGFLLTEMLCDMGYNVCGLATTEAAAVDAALQDRPDLMIVDARLGSGSGVAAVETISRTMPVPHIFVSGNTMSVRGASAIVLQKPFSQRELSFAIGCTIGAATAAGGDRTAVNS